MTLKGIRVIDWTQWQQGPVATAILGDMGADVIKIEDRVTGDPIRGMMRIAGAMAKDKAASRNIYFELLNRNKRCITLDLKKEKARDIVYGLLKVSDVFVHNFRAESVKKLGLDYETASKINPGLVYASCSGWGSKGPDKDAPAFDFAALARSGFISMITKPGNDPWLAQAAIADQAGAAICAMGILSALVGKQLHGIGQHVESSILSGMAYLLQMPIGFHLTLGVPITWGERKSAGNPLWNYYRCQDEKWLALTMVSPDPYWPTMCRLLGMEEFANDERYNSMEKRSANAAVLIEVMDREFATKTSQEWAAIFKQNDIVFSLVNTIEEYTRDPQPAANGYIIDYEHPQYGKGRLPGFPISFSKTPCSIERPAPEFGQHTEEILNEVLGYSWDQIAELKGEEVI